MTPRVPNVLAIAGSDPSGGAGIQADLKTFAALRVYGCAAITALTAQNTVEVSAVFPVPAAFLRAQLDAVFGDVAIDAVKIGMLGSADAVRVVADAVRRYGPSFVVLDPVLRASTGARLLDPSALQALRDELLPIVTLVTPNADEAGALLGAAAPRTTSEARSASEQLVRLGVRAALVTGGHLQGGHESVDVLHDGSEGRELRVARVSGSATHGSGCTLSSAIAALLARGHSLPDACADAQRFVAAAIESAAALHIGQGDGPVHQLGALWREAERPA